MTEEIGSILANRYRVEAFLGRGGMAEVYKVWDSERAVHLAMKALHADLAEDRIFIRRFKREGGNLSKLQHPHIVRFYGLEEADDSVFMLMDYVDGITLRREIFKAKQPLPIERIQQIMRPVCSALHYAHNLGMVHCDIKPANIMIHKNGTVLLTDFGIARMSDAATATMVGAGTPAYMAPEQVRGEEPSPQTDIYGLGILLFEMLTGGERPFTGEQALITGSTGEKVRWEQMNLDTPDPKKWNPDITSKMNAVVLKCLAKKNKDRYSNSLEAYNAFEKGLGSQIEADISEIDFELIQEVKQVEPEQMPERVSDPELETGQETRKDISENSLARGEKSGIQPKRKSIKRNLRYIMAEGSMLVVIAISIGWLIMGTLAKFYPDSAKAVIVSVVSQLDALTDTLQPTQTPKPLPTPKPTSTPKPKATTDPEYEEFQSHVQKYYEEGLFPSLDGEYQEMDDFKEEWAQMKWFQWWSYDITATNFMLSTHFKWASASGTPDLAGCGVIFAIQDDGQNYAVFLDKDRIYFTRSDKKYYHEIGTTKGTGRVEYDVSDDADFILIANEKYAYVIVDGKLIGEYTLSQDQPIQGQLGFSILSGTNKDYGTRCEITGTKIWIIDP